jgi:hypothetical protein
MRIMRFALAGTAVIAAGMLTVIADPASAASRTRSACNGRYQAVQNGQCISTRYANPDRATGGDPLGGAQVYYRSTHKRHKHHS